MCPFSHFDGIACNGQGYRQAAENLRLELLRLWRQAAEAVVAGFPPKLHDGTLRYTWPRAPVPSHSHPPPRQRARTDQRQGALSRSSLGDVNVIFEVSDKLYPLNEQAATVAGENLRRKAAGQLGNEGVEGAREVADEIELVLVGTSSEPIQLGRERADAVFFVLNVTDRPGDPKEADAHALYLALRKIHDERLRSG